MTSKVIISGLDKSGEGTSFTVNIANLTEPTFDAGIAQAEALQDAVQGISLIAFDGLRVYALNVDKETAKPASPYAQREAKWLVSVSDTVTGKLSQFEIGGPDLDLLASDGKTLDISAGNGAAFKAAVELDLLSPDGNAVLYQQAVHVGRNN